MTSHRQMTRGAACRRARGELCRHRLGDPGGPRGAIAVESPLAPRAAPDPALARRAARPPAVHVARHQGARPALRLDGGPAVGDDALASAGRAAGAAHVRRAVGRQRRHPGAACRPTSPLARRSSLRSTRGASRLRGAVARDPHVARARHQRRPGSLQRRSSASRRCGWCARSGPMPPCGCSPTATRGPSLPRCGATGRAARLGRAVLRPVARAGAARCSPVQASSCARRAGTATRSSCGRPSRSAPGWSPATAHRVPRGVELARLDPAARGPRPCCTGRR